MTPSNVLAVEDRGVIAGCVDNLRQPAGNNALMAPSSILVVEDERIIARCIETQLKEMGYVVAGSASTGEEAVRKAVELRPDLILMDINLGSGIDGVEAACLIRKQRDVPVVYLTANSDRATIQRAKLTDPFGYVLKPYEDNALRTAIEIGLYRHKLEWRLRENEQWLAATLGSIGDGVIATDTNGRVRFMNGLAEHLTGWSQADALGRDVREVFQIIGEGSRKPVLNPILDAISKGEPATLAPDTLLINRGGKELSIDDSASPIRDASGEVSGAVLVFRDITERKRLEDHLRQAQKMEAIGRLAGGIAHDFNNIITVIAGFSELLLADAVLPAPMPAAERIDSLRNIRDAGMRAAALTQQIMAFSRKQMLVPCVLNLNTLLRDIGVMIKRLIGENIEFEINPDPDLGHVKADPTQIGQVLLNLAANARDAMPNGGRLVVTTTNTVLDEGTARTRPDLERGGYAMLSVRDTGFGMSDGVRAHVFDPFFTTKGVGEGTGLGLATVYGIITQSRGHVEVASTVGEGTTFRVYLPLVAEPTTPPAGQETRAAAKGRETILLVEDDETVRKMTRMVLQRSGYKVIEASDGLMAVEIGERQRDPIHLLLTDLIMPRLSGREAAGRLTALNRGMKVLYMSGYTEDMLVHQGVESAASDFLHKPFSISALTGKVREILDRL
ncbi:ATP-binding response regulator [Zavarzinella formosa]|uniref:ATP-binding response regulator n=1 Tax=Zavarzinella formosa TaxID=360055 RepID=UPI0002E990D6|nr:hybrid sensor histidine kinase/response regulator [Zavarzinella formosa]